MWTIKNKVITTVETFLCHHQHMWQVLRCRLKVKWNESRLRPHLQSAVRQQVAAALRPTVTQLAKQIMMLQFKTKSSDCFWQKQKLKFHLINIELRLADSDNNNNNNNNFLNILKRKHEVKFNQKKKKKAFDLLCTYNKSKQLLINQFLVVKELITSCLLIGGPANELLTMLS